MRQAVTFRCTHCQQPITTKAKFSFTLHIKTPTTGTVMRFCSWPCLRIHLGVQQRR